MLLRLKYKLEKNISAVKFEKYSELANKIYNSSKSDISYRESRLYLSQLISTSFSCKIYSVNMLCKTSKERNVMDV